MWQHVYETQTDVQAERLWDILADIPNWPACDPQIERVEIDPAPAVGVTFMLRPRGGPDLDMRIEVFEPIRRYADVCRMPLASMLTTHEFIPNASGTQIRVTIEIKGPLTFLWRRLAGKPHANGLPEQTQRIIARARSLPSD